ncbi:uncharacterized protein [Oscarella lobularis]|uniref:uncharacterized protein n=1 Tax=Oscarella lobularis TaxID=121494 RepID=UPI003313D0FE
MSRSLVFSDTRSTRVRIQMLGTISCDSPWLVSYDKIKSSVVMEDLKGHRIMRYDLMEGKVNLEAVRCVAKFAAHIHCATLLADLSQSDQAMLLKYFENPVIVMVQLTKD